MTAESSKDDEEWNTRVCNFVTAHGKRVFPYVLCANCIIPRESTERRELYVHACVCDTTFQYRLHNFPRCSSSVYREMRFAKNTASTNGVAGVCLPVFHIARINSSERTLRNSATFGITSVFILTFKGQSLPEFNFKCF